jgi:phosphoribosylglycinamide formyltransferase 1
MKQLAILISGRGSNFEAIADSIATDQLKAKIAAVLSNNPEAAGLEAARKRGLKAVSLPSKGMDSDTYAAKVVETLAPLKIDLICLAGFMRRVGQPLLDAYAGRILNIHPSLLPSFPGLEVQKAALEYGVKFSGCTVHFVDAGIDSGPIVTQAAVPVLNEDTPETLAARILVEEHRIYAEAIELVLSGHYRLEGRRVVPTAAPLEEKPALFGLMEQAETDTRRFLGPDIAARLSYWRQHASYSEGDLVRFLKEWLRRDQAGRVLAVERGGGVSVERIALDYYPERFTEEEKKLARKSLGR